MTHKARRDRRLRIALAVKNGSSLAAAARRFGVATATIRAACYEHDVHIARSAGPGPNPDTIAVLADILRGMRHSDIADKWGVTRQMVGQLARRAATRPVKHDPIQT